MHNYYKNHSYGIFWSDASTNKNDFPLANQNYEPECKAPCLVSESLSALGAPSTPEVSAVTLRSSLTLRGNSHNLQKVACQEKVNIGWFFFFFSGDQPNNRCFHFNGEESIKRWTVHSSTEKKCKFLFRLIFAVDSDLQRVAIKSRWRCATSPVSLYVWCLQTGGLLGILFSRCLRTRETLHCL